MKIGAEWLHRGSDRCALAKQFSTWALMIAIFCTTWSGLSKSFSVWIIPLVDIAYMTTALWNWNFSVTITIALLQHSSQYHCTGLPCTHCEWVEMYISTIYRLSCICTEAHKRYITSCTAQWVNWSWYARPCVQNASVAGTQPCSQAPYQSYLIFVTDPTDISV